MKGSRFKNKRKREMLTIELSGYAWGYIYREKVNIEEVDSDG